MNMTADLALISWNVTRRCNLRCAHCYLDAGARDSGEGELTTAEGLRLIDEITDLAPGAMLIFSGGEPLLRADLCDLIAHASARGLMPVVGTNGLLLDDAAAGRLAENGAAAVGLSLDSLTPEKHDAFRGAPGAWRQTVAALAVCHRAGLAVQVQTTAMPWNLGEIPALIAFASEQGAAAFNLFFLVCTGRGGQLTDITPAQYEAALTALLEAEAVYRGRMIVRARCAPYFRRLIYQRAPDSHLLALGVGACLAGTSYCRVTPEGDVTPCPYLPLVAGSLRAQSFAEIWTEAETFRQLRRPVLGGRCGVCEFGSMCGGCRARAYAAHGDLLGEDRWCNYQPGSGPAPPMSATEDRRVEWTEAAWMRLERVPPFVRPMVRRGVEAYALSLGLTTITPALMLEVREKAMPMQHGNRLAQQ